MIPEGPLCLDCGWNTFSRVDGEAVCNKCGVVNPDIMTEMDAEYKLAFDIEAMTTNHQIIDKSKIVPLGVQEDMISEASKGNAMQFHPTAYTKDYEGKSIKAFLVDPYNSGQLVGKGGKVVEELLDFGICDCKHEIRSKKQLIVGQYMKCKKCHEFVKVLRIEKRLVHVHHKLSTDDLFYRNCKIELNDMCRLLRLDPLGRNYLGDEFDSDYQKFVNLLQRLIPRLSAMTLISDYKGLALKSSEILRQEYINAVEEMRKIVLNPLQVDSEQSETMMIEQ